MPTNNQQLPSNHRITLEEAVKMTQKFRGLREQILKPEHIGKDLLPFSDTFNRDAFDQLLAQPACAGIRGYLGMDDNLQVKLIFVAVNEKNEDILPPNEEVIIEYGSRCPPYCSLTGPLSTGQ